MYKVGQELRITEKWRNYRIANYNDPSWRIGEIVTIIDVNKHGDVLIQDDHAWMVWTGRPELLEPMGE